MIPSQVPKASQFKPYSDNQQEPASILIAEDDEVVGALLSEVMQMQGYRVLQVFNGEECLEAYGVFRPDIVLLDAMMPVMDGFTCCRHLSAMPNSKFTPILLITALNDSESVNQAFAAGATDYITKPIHWTVLCQRVRLLIQKSKLDRQVEQLNLYLEHQVQERTAQLKQALKFEATLRRIADKVRDSLDEGQILQTAVRELAETLGVSCCNAALYDNEHSISRVCYEYAVSMSGYLGRTIHMEQYPEIYQQLKQGQYFFFCNMTPSSSENRVTMFACPMINSEGTVGDLWLINSPNWKLNELEIHLIQQVASQCAIAIRQARLYQAAQVQVAELAKVNQLKDDFLCTVSHELRTPITTIKMMLQMLELIFDRSGSLEEKHNATIGYLPILQNHCDEEIKLIDDLLRLQQLEAGEEPLLVEVIDVKTWLPQMVESFMEGIEKRQQSLDLDLPENLPMLISNVFCVERILTELLTNACKYTPDGEQINISVSRNLKSLQFKVTNTGVEIPAAELPRIFDKFYRIPHTDRWKHGGTGLGLALVKRLADHLGGSIKVESSQAKTCFMVELPINSLTQPYLQGNRDSKAFIK
ncbi:MAG TPA: ATP-binding protein [Leptolyngbyaceae cyanobacterium]